MLTPNLGALARSFGEVRVFCKLHLMKGYWHLSLSLDVPLLFSNYGYGGAFSSIL